MNVYFCVCVCVHACMCVYTCLPGLYKLGKFLKSQSDSSQSKIFLCYSSVRQKTISIHTRALSAPCSVFRSNSRCLLCCGYHVCYILFMQLSTGWLTLSSTKSKLVPSVTLFHSHQYGDLVSDPPEGWPCFRSTWRVTLFQIHLSWCHQWHCFRSTCMATLFQIHLYSDLVSGPPKLVPSVTLFQIHRYRQPCFRSTCTATLF